MPKDVIITPASGLVDFKDTSGNVDAYIQLDDSGNLNITNAGGVLSIGNTAANLYIGDGTNSVDIIFEQSGKIRALTNKTLTLGQSDSYLNIAAPTSFVSPDGTKSITARMLNTDVLSFQGGAGELLSLSDSMSGTIFSVNDVSGIPSIEVLDTGLIKLAPFGGAVSFGNSTGSSGQVLVSQGSSSPPTWGSPSVVWSRKTANYTAVVGDSIIADTSGGAFTITLPASPSTGNSVTIADGATWGTNNLTIARNGSTIEGVADDITVDITGLRLDLIYDGTTWEVFAAGGASAVARGGGSDQVFFENGTSVNSSYSITNGMNAMSAGPITILSTAVVTIPSGSTWTIV